MGLAVDLNTTCAAGVGTLTLELGILSRLLGDPTYENMARRAVRALWDMRHPHTGLVGEGDTPGAAVVSGCGGCGQWRLLWEPWVTSGGFTGQW